MVKKSSNSEQDAEDEGRDDDAEKRSVAALGEHAAIDGERAAHEIDQGIFADAIEESGDPRQQGGHIPFPLQEKGPEAVHEQARDRGAEAQTGDGIEVDAGVHRRRAERALGVPEEAADQGKQKHHRQGHRDRDAQKHDQEQKHPSVVEPDERRHELLRDDGEQDEDQETDGVTKHKYRKVNSQRG